MRVPERAAAEDPSQWRLRSRPEVLCVPLRCAAPPADPVAPDAEERYPGESRADDYVAPAGFSLADPF